MNFIKLQINLKIILVTILLLLSHCYLFVLNVHVFTLSKMSKIDEVHVLELLLTVSLLSK